MTQDMHQISVVDLVSKIQDSHIDSGIEVGDGTNRDFHNQNLLARNRNLRRQNESDGKLRSRIALSITNSGDKFTNQFWDRR